MSIPPTEFDLAMMRRAISLGMRARGTAEPNPTVGCVIVKDGRIIGEGYTQPYGGAHAEPTALANCTESPAGATAYVTLEPCCHTNKKTPPCVPQVIAAGIRRVFVGTLDPNPAVNGEGIAQLRRAGIEVVAPVLEAEAEQLHAPFIARVILERPYVTLKWAESADGYVAGIGRRGLVHGKRVQISGEQSMRQVHELRARSDAILVGANTMCVDDPKLTARGVAKLRPLIRTGLGSRRGPYLNPNLSPGSDEPVVLYCTDTAMKANPQRAARMKDEERFYGVQYVVTRESADGLIDLHDVLADLHERRVTHLMVEPGPMVAGSFFREGLVDRVWRFRAGMRFGEEGRPAPVIPEGFVKVGEVQLGPDVLEEWLNSTSDAYFAPAESADLVRVRQAAS